jgi:nucleotide-binding universal stress UspA family protein
MIATQATQAKQATLAKSRVAFENILFATDFSSASNVALPYAAEMARTFGAKLIALHVKEPVNYALSPEVWASAEAACEFEMDELRKQLKQEGAGVSTEVLAGEGGLWPALASLLEARRIDLVVLGTRGRTGIGKALLGSQAEEILRRATCPVLTVGPHAAAEGARGAQPKSILFATDFGPASTAAAALAVSLAEHYQSKLTMLHVLRNLRRNETAVPEIFEDSDKRNLEELVPTGANLAHAPHFIVEEGEPPEKILQVAERVSADLIILGVHKMSGVPGAATHLPIATIHQVVAHAACPVLTVHP